MKRFLILFLLCFGLLGCQSVLTIKPKPVTTDVVAYDGTAQNNGIVAQDATGLVITPAKRDHYNTLIDIYGAEKWKDTGLPCFIPAIQKDFGITKSGEYYHLDNGAISNYALMVQWFKSGRAPK